MELRKVYWKKQMNCWHCNTKLIWGGDHDIQEDDELFDMITNLSCPSCGAHVDVYKPKETMDEDIDKY